MVGEGGSSNPSFTRTRVPSIVRLEDTCQVLGAVREFYWSLNRALGGDTLAAAGERLLSGSAGGFTAEQQTADRVQQNEQGSAAPGRAGGRSERQGVAAPETQSTAGTSFRRF